MKTYPTFLTNCSKCNTEIERDARWEGRKHECSLCRDKRIQGYVQQRDRAFKRLAESIEGKHADLFTEAKKDGRSKYDVYEELMDAGII